jgi:hypothetical protein
MAETAAEGGINEAASWRKMKERRRAGGVSGGKRRKRRSGEAEEMTEIASCNEE